MSKADNVDYYERTFCPMEEESDLFNFDCKKRKPRKKKTTIHHKTSKAEKPKTYVVKNQPVAQCKTIYDYNGYTHNVLRPVEERDELFTLYGEHWKAFEIRYGKPAYLARLYFLGTNTLNDVLMNLERSMYEEELQENKIGYDNVMKVLYNIYFYNIPLE